MDTDPHLDDTRSAWRLRDVVTDFLDSQSEGTPATDKPMTLSSDYEVAACLESLRRNKPATVRSAFDAGATALLESIVKMEREIAKDKAQELPTFDQDDLPAILRDHMQLEELRAESMTKSSNDGSNHKDDSKRKMSSSSNTVKAETGGGGTEKKSEVRKFTRNTPASSAAALDSRLNSSRAILCGAANVALDSLTAPLPGLEMADVSDVPQNPNNLPTSKTKDINMGQIVVEARSLGQRVASVAMNASNRAKRRYEYRKNNLKFSQPNHFMLQLKNPFAWDSDEEEEKKTEDYDAIDMEHEYRPNEDSITPAWSEHCLPRLISIIHTGVGHAVYHDVEWSSRCGRVADMFSKLARDDGNFGLHLIITTEAEVDQYAREFRSVNSHLRLMSFVSKDSLRAMKYAGNTQQRARLRKRFPDATGLAEAPFHVIVTSYSTFLYDYLHFCQTPFEVVVVDGGAAWMSAAQGDPNSPIGTLWNDGIFSRNDQRIGLAVAFQKKWDYSKIEIEADSIKSAWIGLTARHRLLTSSALSLHLRHSQELVPISGLVSFISPHFADIVREEWDRSRISSDESSMEHFRKHLTRSVVVHHPTAAQQDMHELALMGLHGKLPPSRIGDAAAVPEVISDEKFVSQGKVAFARRTALQWLGEPDESWLRYELGSADFKPILEAMKTSLRHGHVCEEVTQASLTTSVGATGQITGPLAYRCAVRCGRKFTTEQALRQHLSTVHAPPGTWLCRACGSDCITSQARTHHERSCGQPLGTTDAPRAPGPTATVGKASHGTAGTAGKKKTSKSSQATPEEKDPDGSIRVPSYRGVWVSKTGKHFVKIDNERLKGDDDATKFFDSIDEAALKYDEEMKARRGKGNKVEYNFKADGTRIVYDDVSTSSTTGLGGSASSVVPALSVINIKDLPPHVKPLLRDPRQARAGGNPKKQIYAYRGVCRQSRKGKDRWQSQISFMGVNHYLGTFESEWDAAAIYAWAHLILYGEEATKQAQKEGEEAAAAYEHEKRGIAEGKIQAPLENKTDKKRKSEKKDDGTKAKKKKVGGSVPDKPTKSKAYSEKESLAPVLAKGVAKASVLAPRAAFHEISDDDLFLKVTAKLQHARKLNYKLRENMSTTTLLSCFPSPVPSGAMLIGLSPSLFGWDSEVFIASQEFKSDLHAREANALIAAEYGDDGTNENFRTFIRGKTTIIGSPGHKTRRAVEQLPGCLQSGSGLGKIDCNIGGDIVSCTESAACIRFLPSAIGDFQFQALSDDDIVTVNGRRIKTDAGSFPLFNQDICTVGSRVFVFLLPHKG